jgi:hypothetical protein
MTLCVLLLACFVRIAPAAAQSVTPPTAEADVIAERVAAAVQQVGGTSNAIQLIVVGIVLVVAWKGLSPLLATIKSLNDARDELQGELFKRLEAGDKERAKTAEINERTVSALNERETKQEAEARSDAAVVRINTHTDSAHDVTRKEIAELRKEVSTVIHSLERVEKRLGGGDGDDTADLSLSAAFHMLKHIERRLDQLGTGPLDPAKVPAEPPAPSGVRAAAEPDIWSGDHPAGLPPETK